MVGLRVGNDPILPHPILQLRGLPILEVRPVRIGLGHRVGSLIGHTQVATIV